MTEPEKSDPLEQAADSETEPHILAARETEQAAPAKAADSLPDAADAAPHAVDQLPDAVDSLPDSVAAAQEADRQVLAASGRYTRRAFLVAGLASAAGYAGYYALDNAPADEMQPSLIRKIFRLNAALSRETFSDAPLAPTY